MSSAQVIMGIDIGSISISAAAVSLDGSVVQTESIPHGGDIEGGLRAILPRFPLTDISGIAVTSSTPDIIRDAITFDLRLSFITAAKRFHPDMGGLLIVGGEKFGLVIFDEKGDYQNYRSNTSCAAGTGSFLDQQAVRLNLTGIEEFAEVAYSNQGEIPKIASRCAVFAKTDLIHAQQEGYSHAAICDGLSYGLAKNISDTLFSGVTLHGPLIFAGGVSRNSAVRKHIAAISGEDVLTDDYAPCYGAIGAALLLIDEPAAHRQSGLTSPDDIILNKKKVKNYYYEPLELKLSNYPVFESRERYEFSSKKHPHATPVEIDIYEPLARGELYPVYLGIDIGSTSTKVVLLDERKRVLAGFYTRTAGRPIDAVQVIFEAIDDMVHSKGADFLFIAAGSTGSGRKFIAEIIGADIALDEISAHARAATELDPSVDTIIEIGGQDSKFTTLRNGMVTFSIMNNVCAAGTGSFIEEQAKKLGCPLSEYSGRAEKALAPLASDRCTVFMERDINYYLSEGYSVDEALASVLHSVRENYLTKVAVEQNIGEKIFFQGATAKNRALVAAFEQRLGKPIMVSQFCHLTGAMGVALHLLDEGVRDSSFRGIDIYSEKIPVRTEVCELCTNHCKINVAEVGGETAAFGFLCGRDYNTQKFIAGDRGFDLLKERKKAEGPRPRIEYRSGITVGIPAALHLMEDLPLWTRFFDELGIKTITTRAYRDGLSEGKKITGAEFCAPMTALHGDVRYLTEHADFVFLPEYIEIQQKDKQVKRNYCYYTQYSSTIVSLNSGVMGRDKILTPVIRSIYSSFHVKAELYRMVKRITGGGVGFLQVSSALERAEAYHSECQKRYKEIFDREARSTDDIDVVFLGRPYTLLSGSMNNSIPDIFAKLGIRTFFQDMIEYTQDEVRGIEGTLREIHWRYAAKILETAEAVSRRQGLYPVLVTSFKCTPDAYVIDIFKRLLDERGLPYLILQLDEHGSNVGYETRIEAGVRSFRNHYRKNIATESQLQKKRGVAGVSFQNDKDELYRKTLLMPNWDDITCRLLEAVLKKEGIDARVIDQGSDSIRRSMKNNTGQCIPLTIISQNVIDYIEKNGLDPAKTVVWTPNSQIACNIGMFSYYQKNYFDRAGKSFAGISVYRGEISFIDMSVRVAIQAYLAYMFGGMLRKIGCRIRPYENRQGETDRALELSGTLLYNAILNDSSKEAALDKVISLFEGIAVTYSPRPRVAIFGDLYVRDNDVMNQNLIKVIEDNGGEVVTTPYNEYMRIIADPYIKKWFKQGLYSDAAIAKVLQQVIPYIEKRYYSYFNRIIPDAENIYTGSPEKIMQQFKMRLHHTGESMENILKIAHLTAKYPDLALFVQTNPSYCCPSLVTQAMVDRVEDVTGIPVVTIEYDGTEGSRNEDVIPYLRYPRTVRNSAVEGAL